MSIKRKIFSLTPENEEARQAIARMRVLFLAEQLNNVSQACNLLQVDRTSFYKWKKRFEEEGCNGLIDKVQHDKIHPKTTNEAMIGRILEAALWHPRWGCNKLADYLKEQGNPISAPTIQKILNSRQLGKRKERELAAQKANQNGADSS